MIRHIVRFAPAVLAVALLIWGAAVPAAEGLPAFPDGADIIISLNGADIRSQPSFDSDMQKLLSQLDDEATREYNEFKAKTGMDPARDLDAAAIAVYLPAPKADGTEGDPDFLAIVRGRFSPAKIGAYVESMATKEGGKATQSTHNGVAVYEIVEPGPGADMAYLGITNTSLVIGNRKPLIQKTIDAVTAGKMSADPKLKTLMDGVDMKATLWAVGLMPAKPAPPAADPQNPAMMPPDPTDQIKSFAFSLDGKQGVNLKVDINCKDANAAMMMKNQAEMLRGMAGMMLLQSGANLTPEAATKFNQMLQKIQCNAVADKVSVAFILTQAEKDELVKILNDLKTKLDAQAKAADGSTTSSAPKSPEMAPRPQGPAGF